MIKFINGMRLGPNTGVGISDHIFYKFEIRKGETTIELDLPEFLTLRLFIERVEKLIKEEHA